MDTEPMPRQTAASDDGAGRKGDAPTVSKLTLEEVYRTQFDYVYRCLWTLGVRDDRTDDALQDVFLVVQDKLSQFDGRVRLRTWLHAITLRVARRYRERSAKNARRFVDGSEPHALCIEQAEFKPHVISGEQAVLDAEQLQLAHKALSALDPQKREVFVLSMVEQCSAPEIAEMTQLPLNTVYSRLRAARAAFTQAITRLQRDKARSQP